MFSGACAVYGMIRIEQLISTNNLSSDNHLWHKNINDIRVRPQTAMLGDIWGVSGDMTLDPGPRSQGTGSAMDP